jgi:hypothetical protein
MVQYHLTSLDATLVDMQILLMLGRVGPGLTLFKI